MMDVCTSNVVTQKNHSSRIREGCKWVVIVKLDFEIVVYDQIITLRNRQKMGRMNSTDQKNNINKAWGR